MTYLNIQTNYNYVSVCYCHLANHFDKNANFVDMHQPPPANNKPDFRGLVLIFGVLCCRTNVHRPLAMRLAVINTV